MKSMSKTSAIFRRFRTRGVARMTCTRLDIEHGKEGVRVRLSLDIERWSGEALELAATAVDRDTGHVISTASQVLTRNDPVLNGYLDGLEVTVPMTESANCNVLLSVYDGLHEVCHATSRPLRYRLTPCEPPRPPTPRQQARQARRAEEKREQQAARERQVEREQQASREREQARRAEAKREQQAARERAKREQQARQREQTGYSGNSGRATPNGDREHSQSSAEALLGLCLPYDRAALKAAFRAALRNAHPDRFATGSAADRMAANDWTRRIIEAHERLVAGCRS